MGQKTTFSINSLGYTPYIENRHEGTIMKLSLGIFLFSAISITALSMIACNPEIEAAILAEEIIEFEAFRQLGIPRVQTHEMIEYLEQECCTIV